jgi:hypothetical protein
VLALDLNVAGLEETRTFLGNMPVALKASLVKAMLELGGELRSAIEAGAPVGKTGALRASIKANVTELRGGVQLDVSAGSNQAFYARWVEAGHFIRRTGRGRFESLTKHRTWTIGRKQRQHSTGSRLTPSCVLPCSR